MARTETVERDRVAELHEQLAASIENLTSSEDWAQMLTTAARFHHYSFGNVMLICSQRPDATRVAGYKTWQGLGRQVRKGERGISIFAPMGGPCKDCGGSGHHPTDRSLTCGRCMGTGRWAAFRVVYVFDLAQTEGDDLPGDVRPVLLEGEAPYGAWDGLAAQVAEAGYRLDRVSSEWLGSANGKTDPGSRIVSIRSDVDDAQAVKTLAHELGHILLGHCDSIADYQGCRGRCEVEAESVAYLVGASLGLTTDGYSLPYVARWADGDVKVVRDTADRVIRAARAILAVFEATQDHELVPA